MSSAAPIEIVPVSVTLDSPEEVNARLRFDVGWQGAGNAGDRIVIAGPEDADLDYRYIDPAQPGVELVAPATVGNYTLQYISRGGRVIATEPLAVTASPMPPGELLVLQNRAALGPDDAVEIILDASGSMLQRLGGERRIEIARDTLVSLVNDTIPEGTGFALRVFGHREADSCRTDLEIPLGFCAIDADGLSEAMTRAVATRFKVIDSADGEVATGMTGGDPIPCRRATIESSDPARMWPPQSFRMKRRRSG